MATTIATRTEQRRTGKHPATAGLLLRTQPDPRLAELCHDGSEAAFEEVVRRYRAPLLAYAATISPQRADDVTQDALTKAFLALQRDQITDLRPWLYKIVRNTALDDLSANRRIHEQLDENYDGVEQPPQAIERRQQLAAIVGGLLDLPERQREAIVKHELEGLEHREIAGDLDVSVGAVKQLIHRGRRRLREVAGLLVPASLVRALVASATELSTSGTVSGAGNSAGSLLVKGGATVAVIAATAGAAIHDQSASRLAAANQAVHGNSQPVSRSHAPGAAARGVPGTPGAPGVQSSDGSAEAGPASGSHGQSGLAHGNSQLAHGNSHSTKGLDNASSHVPSGVQPGGGQNQPGQHQPPAQQPPPSQPQQHQHQPAGGGDYPQQGGSGGGGDYSGGGGGQHQPPSGGGSHPSGGSYNPPPPPSSSTQSSGPVADNGGPGSGGTLGGNLPHLPQH
jgi:RNA polymerase sigma factor (sigma-70 family)